MAEKVQGSFTFTILDQDNKLYFVKGENPLSIYHYPDLGLYLYASTAEILDSAIASIGMEKIECETVQTWPGDILRIDRQGKCETAAFDLVDSYSRFSAWPPFNSFSQKHQNNHNHITQQEYLQAVKTVAMLHGFETEYIGALIADGYTLGDIEEMIYCGGCSY